MSQKFEPFTISIDNEQEAQSLMQLIDAGNRHLGANGAAMTLLWIQKVHSASQIAQAAAASVAMGAAAANGKRKGNGKH